MMTAIPWELFSSMVKGDDIKRTGVGMFFLPQVLKRNTDENIYYARACIGQSACVCGVWCVCVWCVYVVCVCVCVCVLYI
jgi:hypothetical protein